MVQYTFGSAFAGIGGFDLGLERAGWECKWQIENNPFCNKVLEKHWFDAKRYGDITEIDPTQLETVDLICGGFPCQDLSVAGKREGLSGERSGLFWELVRLIRGLKPQWLLIENVPGWLSSHEGEDFAVAIKTLAECGYGLAWRVLDSQYFGVPQRRRRVFIVGYFGAMCPPEILFESEGGEGNIKEGGKVGEGIVGPITPRLGGSGAGWPRWNESDGLIAETFRSGGRGGCPPSSRGEHIIWSVRTAHTKANEDNRWWEEETPPLYGTEPVAVGPLQARDYKGVGTQYVQEDKLVIEDAPDAEFGIYAQGPDRVFGEEADPNGVREASGVPRRMDLPMCRCLDSPRYRALGNAVTVQVAEWIGRRIYNYEKREII